MSHIHPFRRSEHILNELHSQKWVYRYLTLESAVKYIVCKDGALRLNTLEKMNDPRESKQWSFNLCSPNDWKEPTGTSTYWFERIRHALTHWPKLLCFSLDSTNYISAMNELFGRGFLKPRMWAQYGDSHKGVCLVFDKQMVGQSIRGLPVEQVYEGNVHYDFVQNINGIPTYFFLRDSGHQSFSLPELVSLGDDALLQQIKTKASSFFFAKHQDWSSENEYRWVALRCDNNPIYAPVAGSLSGIVVGQDAKPEETEKLVKAVIDYYPEVPVVQFNWSTTLNCQRVLHMPPVFDANSFW